MEIIFENDSTPCRKINGSYFYIKVEVKKLPFGIRYKRAYLLAEEKLCTEDNMLGLIANEVFNANMDNMEIFSEMSDAAIEFLRSIEEVA